MGGDIEKIISPCVFGAAIRGYGTMYSHVFGLLEDHC